MVDHRRLRVHDAAAVALLLVEEVELVARRHLVRARVRVRVRARVRVRVRARVRVIGLGLGLGLGWG